MYSGYGKDFRFILILLLGKEEEERNMIVTGQWRDFRRSGSDDRALNRYLPFLRRQNNVAFNSGQRGLL